MINLNLRQSPSKKGKRKIPKFRIPVMNDDKVWTNERMKQWNKEAKRTRLAIMEKYNKE